MILGFLSAGLIFEVHAGQVLEQPFIFEYNLEGPATVESEIIEASGTIKTVFLSIESEGRVSLEVSTNGGRAYTKIINGQPLGDGFIPGNELCFRANIAKDSVLKKITLGYTDSSGVSKLYRNSDLANYKYHKKIYISGASQEVFNYPLKINLDKSDIYFTAADGQTPLYYYLENQVDCYVKVPQIPKEGTTIYLYYNKKGLSGAPGEPVGPQEIVLKANKYLDPNKVFPFFDDFNEPALNKEKWEVAHGLKKEYSIKDGYLQLKDGLIISRNFKLRDGIIEFKAKAGINAGIQVMVFAGSSGKTPLPYEQTVYSSNYPGAEHTIAINDISKLNMSNPIQPFTYYIYKVAMSPTGIIFERYSQNYDLQAEIQFMDVGNLNEGCIGLKATAVPFKPGSAYFDWIRARPYIEVEPRILK